MASPSGPSHTHTVLIVEDSDDGRESLALLLELSGHQVVAARSAMEALQLMITLGARPCVLIVDIILNGIDGITLRGAMDRYPEIAGIPAIALTGHEPLRRRASASGFASALLKPCTPETLCETIERCCVAKRLPAKRA